MEIVRMLSELHVYRLFDSEVANSFHMLAHSSSLLAEHDGVTAVVVRVGVIKYALVYVVTEIMGGETLIGLRAESACSCESNRSS